MSEASLGDNQVKYINITQDDIHYGADYSKIKVIIEYHGKEISLYRKRDREAVRKSKSIESFAKQLQTLIGINVGENGKPEINDRAEKPYRKDLQGYEKLDSWRDSICDGRINSAKFYEWFRKRQELEFSKKIIEKNMDYKDFQLEAVRESILGAMGEKYTDIYYKLDGIPGVYIKKGKIELAMKQLSEGELNVILLIGDISRRLSIANPSFEKSYMGEGIVLIDEIDSHIHPKWQERIVEKLIESFPNIQFVFTTHSPRVLNSLSDNVKVFMIDSESQDETIKEEPPLNGWDVNAVMERFMDADVLNKDIQNLVDELNDSLYKKDLSKSEKILEILKKKTAPDNLEVVRGTVALESIKECKNEN